LFQSTGCLAQPCWQTRFLKPFKCQFLLPARRCSKSIGFNPSEIISYKIGLQHCGSVMRALVVWGGFNGALQNYKCRLGIVIVFVVFYWSVTFLPRTIFTCWVAKNETDNDVCVRNFFTHPAILKSCVLLSCIFLKLIFNKMYFLKAVFKKKHFDGRSCHLIFENSRVALVKKSYFFLNAYQKKDIF
jgi:hypothetical protein